VLKSLMAEESMLINIKRIAGILGVLCFVVFAYTGIAELPERDPALGTAVLVCASALVGMVFCVTRHTNKLRADLGARIRALNQAAGEVRQ